MTDFDKLLLARIDSVKDHVTAEGQATRALIAKNSERIAVLESKQPAKSRQLARDGGLVTGGAALVAGLLQLVEMLK
jgi:hypothetical protein